LKTSFDFFIAFAGRFVLRLSPTFAEDLLQEVEVLAA
jgi:hypothetical protein